MKEIVLEVKLESVGTWDKLVLYKDDPIPLNKQLLELQDISKQKVDQSKTIYLPATESINNQYFGAFENVNNSTFMPYADLEMRITYDGDTLLRGSVYFKGYSHAKREYAILVSGKAGTIRGKMGTKTLEELVTTENSEINIRYDHTLDVPNVVGTWKTTPTVAHTSVFYPLSDSGNGYGLKANTSKVNPFDSGADAGAMWDVGSSQTPIPVEDLRPSINVIDALQDVFTLNDFTLDTSKLSGDATTKPLLDLYALLKLGSSGSSEEALVSSYGLFTSEPYALNETIITRLGLEELNSENMELVYNAAAGGGNVLKINAGAGELQGAIVLRSDADSDAGNGPLGTFYLKALNINTGVSRTVYSETYNIVSSLVVLNSIQFDVELEADEAIYMTVSNNSADTVTIDVQACQLTYRNSSYPDTRYIGNYLSSTTQYDFVKGVLSHLGLFIDYDPDEDVFMLCNYTQLETGVTRDWSQQMEYGSSFDVNSLTEYLANSYTYETADVPSFLNALIKDAYEESAGASFNYGSLSIDLGLRLAAEGVEYKSIFAPCMVEKQAYSLAPLTEGLFISRSFEDIEEPEKSDGVLELFFKKDHMTPTHAVQVRNADLSVSSFTYAPVHSMIKDGLFCGFKYTEGFEQKEGEEVVLPTNDLFRLNHMSRWKEWLNMEYSDFADTVTSTRDDVVLSETSRSQLASASMTYSTHQVEYDLDLTNSDIYPATVQLTLLNNKNYEETYLGNVVIPGTSTVHMHKKLTVPTIPDGAAVSIMGNSSNAVTSSRNTSITCRHLEGLLLDSTDVSSARIINGSVWLTATEYAQFRFGDKISINTEYGTATYRVLSISNFDPYERKACAVKLIKIV